MQGFVDAYRILGVDPEADQATLKAAHRRLVLRHHPDLLPPADRAAGTRRVQDVNVAFGLVRDPERRAAYDRLRRVHLARRQGTAPLRPADRRAAAADRAAARQWSAAVTSAGRWAGRWWRVHGTRVALHGLAARRTAVDAYGRVLWLGTTVLGCAVGFTTVSAVQRLAGLEGPLLPLGGALSGLWIGSYRGWCRRLRMAGLADRTLARRGTLLRGAAGALLLLAGLALDAGLGWR